MSKEIISNGDRVWFVSGGHYDVYHGIVVAAGPKFLLVAVDGPWSNIVHRNHEVPIKMAQLGRAPHMLNGESFVEYGVRLKKILDRDDDIEKLKKEAARLGVKVVEE